MKRWTSLLLVGLILMGCGPEIFGGSVRKDHNWMMQNNAVYRQAKPEIQEKILKGTISETMTIEECKISWSRSWFELVNKRSSGYELWRVKGDDGVRSRTLYLHVRDGIVTEISAYYR